MKKILFTMALAAIAMICDAQLVVDSVGHVGIGTQTPWTRPLLSVGNRGGWTLMPPYNVLTKEGCTERML